MKVTYEPGMVCVRCGNVKGDRDTLPCKQWDKYFTRHVWNDAPLTMEVEYIEPTRFDSSRQHFWNYTKPQ